MTTLLRARTGRPPYGTRPGEPAVWRYMTELRSQGQGARRIAAELNRLGVPSRSGRPWNTGTIGRLLRRIDSGEVPQVDLSGLALTGAALDAEIERAGREYETATAALVAAARNGSPEQRDEAVSHLSRAVGWSAAMTALHLHPADPVAAIEAVIETLATLGERRGLSPEEARAEVRQVALDVLAEREVHQVERPPP